jgi:hypothetical protein
MRADMHARARARAQPLESSDRTLILEKKKKPSATPYEELERGAPVQTGYIVDIKPDTSLTVQKRQCVNGVAILGP